MKLQMNDRGAWRNLAVFEAAQLAVMAQWAEKLQRSSSVGDRYAILDDAGTRFYLTFLEGKARWLDTAGRPLPGVAP